MFALELPVAWSWTVDAPVLIVNPWFEDDSCLEIRLWRTAWTHSEYSLYETASTLSEIELQEFDLYRDVDGLYQIYIYFFHMQLQDHVIQHELSVLFPLS